MKQLFIWIGISIVSGFLSTQITSCSEDVSSGNASEMVASHIFLMDADDEAFSQDIEEIIISLNNAGGGTKFSGRVGAINPTLIDKRFCENASVVYKNAFWADADTLTVSFPELGCLDELGILRKGAIEIIRNNQTNSCFVTLRNFQINGTNIEGKYSAKWMLGENGDKIYQFKLEEGKNTFADGTTTTRSSVKWVKEVNNSTPFDTADDRWITMASSTDTLSFVEGLNRVGDSYTKAVTKDLVRLRSCIEQNMLVPASGTEVMQVRRGEVEREITIDYGEGECDQVLTLLYEGAIQEFKKYTPKTGLGRNFQNGVSTDMLSLIKNSLDENSYQRDVNELAMLAQSITQHGGTTDELKLLLPSVFCDQAVVTQFYHNSEDADTVVLDFSSAGCKDIQGTTRRGKIIITGLVPSIWKGQKVEFNVSLENYHLNDMKVEGARKMIIHFPQEISDQHLAEVILAEGLITLPDAQVKTASMTMNIFYRYTFSGGMVSFTMLPEYEGKKSLVKGVNFTGQEFEQFVSSNVVRHNCNTPLEGSLGLTVKHAEKAYAIAIDFGKGVCDHTGSIKIDDKESWDMNVLTDIPALVGGN